MTYPSHCGGQCDIPIGKRQGETRLTGKVPILNGKEYRLLCRLVEGRKVSEPLSYKQYMLTCQHLHEKFLIQVHDLMLYRQALKEARVDAARKLGFEKPEDTLRYWLKDKEIAYSWRPRSPEPDTTFEEFVFSDF